MIFLGTLRMLLSDKIRKKKISNLEKLFKEGEMSIVITTAIELIKEYKSGSAYNILALAHKKLGNYLLAQDIYEKLLIDNPKNTLFLGNLGNIYSDIGKLDKAEACFRKSLAIEPKSFNTSVSLGNLYASTYKLDDALSTFYMILEVHDVITPLQLDDINYRIAEVYRQKGDHFLDKAIEYYSRSSQPLSSAHRLELIYKSKDKATYFEA